MRCQTMPFYRVTAARQSNLIDLWGLSKTTMSPRQPRFHGLQDLTNPRSTSRIPAESRVEGDLVRGPRSGKVRYNEGILARPEMLDRRVMGWKRIAFVLVLVSQQLKIQAHVQLLYPLALSPNG